MTTKFTSLIAFRASDSLKASVEQLLTMSSRVDYPTVGDLLRDIVETEVQKRLKKAIKAKEPECDCSESQQRHMCGKE
jgi:hypothetical protein